MVYCRVGGTPYYYLDWYENTDLTELVKSTANLDGTLEEAEAAYGSRIVLVKKESEENTSGTGMAVLYCNKDLPAYKDTNEMGLTVEEIE